MHGEPIQVGEILADKYRVERVLGKGGMGVVVAATHLHLEKEVALKFMLPAHVANAEIAARFTREAKAAARLQSEHIVKVLDVGTLPDGAPFMVMEFLHGSDLEQVVNSRRAEGTGPVPPQEAVDYVTQACLGMAEAHAQGFVHRDLKPPNLFLCRGADGLPLVKVLDFGIAKAAVDGLQTGTHAVMGSPYYMPPEQWQGAKNVDERSDIWALGAILHYLLSGGEPFPGATMPEVFAAIATKDPNPLPKNITKGLQEAVLRCLQKDPNDRPQSMAELGALLAPFGPPVAARRASKAFRIASASGTGRENAIQATAETIAAPHSAAPSATTMRASTGARAIASPTGVPPSSGRRKYAPLLGLVALLAIAGGVVLALGVRRDAPGTPAAAGALAADIDAAALAAEKHAPAPETGAQDASPLPSTDLAATFDAGSVAVAVVAEPQGKASESSKKPRSSRKRESRKAPDAGTVQAARPLKPPAEPPDTTPGPSPDTAPAPQPLSRDQVKAAISSIKGGVVACGQEHGVSGKISASIEISKSGTTRAVVSKGDPEFRRCAESAIGRARLPESSQGASVSYPFTLPASGPKKALSSADLTAGMKFVRPALNACRRNHGDDDPVVIHLVITKGGDVIKARMDDSRAAYKNCIEGVAKRARFSVTREGFKGRFRYRAGK